MICYYFPPLADVGCKRSVAFSKYLKKHGWNPVVLSVANPDRRYCSLGSDIPPHGVPTEYARSLANFTSASRLVDGALKKMLGLLGFQLRRSPFLELVCMPDRFWGWVPLATRKARRIIARESTDVIYVSCSPFSAAMIGIALKRATGKKLVLDYRDPFSIDEVFDAVRLPRSRRRIARFFDRWFVSRADVLIVNNEDTREAYVRQFPEIKSKIFAVHNGFETDFLEAGTETKYEKFTIAYTGEFYFYASSVSNRFFEALALLKGERKINADNFQFVFYGEGKEEIARIAQEQGVADLLVARSRVPYKEVISVLRRSHLQLLRIVKPMISTKLYDGIPLNIPFLATIPEGEVARLIRKFSPSSLIVTDDSAASIAGAILEGIGRYRTQEIQDNKVEEFLESFSRENLTFKLMGILEKCLAGSA
jgi:glycosyltransferase involved in cell wall biosynthesis